MSDRQTTEHVGLAASLEAAFAKAQTVREAREAAQLAADSVPTDNVTVLRERAKRHAYEAVDQYWGYFDDIQNMIDQRVIAPLLDTVSRIVAERDQARRDAELQRAAYFHEAARLLEDTGHDDDAVNLLDNVASGIHAQADDASDNRRRIYIDGKGNGWISVCSDEGTEWVVPVQPEASVEQDVRDVADDTGSLREIGRCW